MNSTGILDDDKDDEYPGLEDDDELAPDYVDPTKSLHKGRMVEAWIEHQDPEEEDDQPGGEAKKRDRHSTAAMIKQWVKSRQTEDGLDDDMEQIEEDKKSRFSNYSMTSSVMRRSNGLRLLDDRFEKVLGTLSVSRGTGLTQRTGAPVRHQKMHQMWNQPTVFVHDRLTES